MIDFKKPVRQKNGVSVQIFCTDLSGYYSVLGVANDDMRIPCTWTEEGAFSINKKGMLDLENVPEEKVLWVNCYEKFGDGVPSIGIAKTITTDGILARIKVTYKVGQFDEE